MVTAEVEIKNYLGIHLRPAALFCEEAQKYNCKITFQVRNVTANAKSVLSVLAAGVKQYEIISLSCDGEDEKEALHALMKLIESGLGDNSMGVDIE